MMYGADLGRLRALLGEFEAGQRIDWDPLLATIRARLDGIFWIGPDRNKTISIIMARVTEPVALFVDDVETARAMLADGIDRQRHASRGVVDWR